MELARHHTRPINVSPTERYLSTIGGCALAAYGLKRRSLGGLFLTLLGGDLIYRGTTGHCHFYEMLKISTSDPSQDKAISVPYGRGIRVQKAVTINKSPEELYRFWRNLENLPRVMSHLASVRVLDDKRSHWVAKGPADMKVEWDAEIVNEMENERIGWRSIDGTQIDHAGSVQFKKAPGGRGTEVTVTLEYSPLGGAIGALIAKLFGEDPSHQVREDLRHFKQWMEAGEIPATEGQPSGRATKVRDDFTRTRQIRLGRSKPKDVVQQASEESFPASDAPAWTTGR